MCMYGQKLFRQMGACLCVRALPCMSYWVLAANLKLPHQRVVRAAAIIKATVFLLLACLRLSLLFLNSINRLVEVKHCGGGREGTHTLTHLKESRAHTHTHALQRPHAHSLTWLQTRKHILQCRHSRSDTTVSRVDRWGLTNMRSVGDDQPLLPAFQTWTHKASLSADTLKLITIWCCLFYNACV